MSDTAKTHNPCPWTAAQVEARRMTGGTRNQQDDRLYATYNGFYLGDQVELPDGRRGCIDEIVHKIVHADTGAAYSVVRLDDELWLDGWLTRV